MSLADANNSFCAGQTGAKKLGVAGPSRPAVSCHATCGRRSNQEDTSITGVQVVDARGVFYEMVAVCDGHGGAQVSGFLRDNLATYIRRHLALVTDVTELPDALHRAFLEADGDLPDHFTDGEGSTAIVALISDTHIVVASTGDSRVILSSGGTGTELVTAHNFELEGEADRVLASGGLVIGCLGAVRLNGVLNMSRAIGDRELRAFGLIPDPEVRVVERKRGVDEFLVVTSDGVSVDGMPAAEVSRLVTHVADRGVAASSSRLVICGKVALHLCGCPSAVADGDNTTVVVVDLMG
jgi:protein phosphatase 2C